MVDLEYICISCWYIYTFNYWEVYYFLLFLFSRSKLPGKKSSHDTDMCVRSIHFNFVSM